MLGTMKLLFPNGTIGKVQFLLKMFAKMSKCANLYNPQALQEVIQVLKLWLYVILSLSFF